VVSADAGADSIAAAATTNIRALPNRTRLMSYLASKGSDPQRLLNMGEHRCSLLFRVMPWFAKMSNLPRSVRSSVRFGVFRGPNGGRHAAIKSTAL
jgi:hypothetical protein